MRPRKEPGEITVNFTYTEGKYIQLGTGVGMFTIRYWGRAKTTEENLFLSKGYFYGSGKQK